MSQTDLNEQVARREVHGTAAVGQVVGDASPAGDTLGKLEDIVDETILFVQLTDTIQYRGNDAPADTPLTLPVKAGRTYHVECQLFSYGDVVPLVASLSSGIPDQNGQFICVRTDEDDPTVTVPCTKPFTGTFFDSTQRSGSSTYIYSGIAVVTADGNYKVRAAQVTIDDSSTQLLPGSWLKLTRVL